MSKEEKRVFLECMSCGKFWETFYELEKNGIEPDIDLDGHFVYKCSCGCEHFKVIAKVSNLEG